MALYKPNARKSHKKTRVLLGRIATGRPDPAMTAEAADLAIFGSSPLSRLLAGLLRQVHGKSVVFVGASHARYRLPREIDLSVGPITRPESWALLDEIVPETTRLLSKIAGRHAWHHVDPVFFADAQWAQEALGHVQHMANAFGISTEMVAPSKLGRDRAGIRLRDVVRLQRPIIEPALDHWLDELGVLRIQPDRVEIEPGGSAGIWVGETKYSARHAVLADDAAIIAHLPLPQWPRLLARRAMSSVLTTPTEPLVAKIMAHIDSGTLLAQQDEGGIAAIGPGDLGSAAARLSRLLADDRQLQQAGQVSYPTLVTADGAPAFGKAAGIGADIIIGLGPTGTFIAPALARWLAGEAAPNEDSWFGERLVGRDSSQNSVAEFHPSLRRTAA